MASPLQLELVSGRSSSGLPFSINSPPSSSTALCYGEALVSARRALLQVSGPIWAGVCRYLSACAGGFGGDGEFMTVSWSRVRVWL